MASFLVRGYEVINAQELERQPTAFTDVAHNTHLAAIEKAATAGFAHLSDNVRAQHDRAP